MFSLQTRYGAARVSASLSVGVCTNCLRKYSAVAEARKRKQEDQVPWRPKQVIFSGIQPTGVPHLGNYLGALRPWVKLQDEGRRHDRFIFAIVDLHAVTTKQDPAQLAAWRTEMFASIVAAGIDPAKSTVFEQSTVHAHSELMWLLSCNASMGYLGRMTQWKSKLSLPSNASPTDPTPANKDALKLGLFSYPVLQAADILLYRATHVPVGEDQAQHIEFTRDLAAGFNHLYAPEDKPILKQPETLLSPAKRIMSLTEPTKKMSKSAPNPKSRILITDSRDDIHAKLRTALTDSIEGVSYDREARPGVTNLIDIMYHMSRVPIATSPEDLAKDMKDLSMRALKEKVADTIDDNIRDVRERYQEIMGAQQEQLLEHRVRGTVLAQLRSGVVMRDVRRAMGLVHGNDRNSELQQFKRAREQTHTVPVEEEGAAAESQV